MIELQDVQKNYNNFQLHLSMEIPDGKITGLVGKNGAGKSTVIKLILGLTKPEEGKVSVLGTTADKLTALDKQKIGVSMAEAGFSKQFRLVDVKQILAKLYTDFNKTEFEKKCQELGLPENKKLRDYSTGMRAKLRAVIAMSHSAKLLIMDEPTAGLDVEARNGILDMLREYVAQDEERTVLITSHIASDLENLCDDIYLIQEGKLLLHEETDAIVEKYGILKADEKQYAALEKDFILKTQKESYGYACLTNEKQYYQENYPQLVIEKGGIDEIILMMTGGYR